MKIIISPSKTQNHEVKEKINKSDFLFSEETINLYHILQKLSKKDLSTTLKIKNDLLDKTYLDLQIDIKDKPLLKAIDCYKGVVFEQLDLETYTESQKAYMDDNLVILSAMYGALAPDNLIFPYRLDMTAKINDINLYKYWLNYIDDYFAEEELIINLASKEFSRMIKNVNFINIEFYEKPKEGKLKVVSYNAKKCRGAMVDFLIKNLVKDIKKIKEFKFEGYEYNQEISDEFNFKFIKSL
ncbi:MAG: YaaA family protein [Candidatus Izemoplasmatales bacterium]